MSEHEINSMTEAQNGRPKRALMALDLTGRIDQRHRFEVPEKTIDDWRAIVDLIAKLAKAPLALISRVDEMALETVSVNQESEDHIPTGKPRPFTDDLCSYCEMVITRQEALTVLDGAREPGWETSPELAAGMVSYVGFPLNLPDGAPFGTLCVMDKVKHEFNDTVFKLMAQFKSLVEGHLALLFVNSALGAENQSLLEMLEEIKTLRGIVPICASCKNVRDDSGFWHSVESYVSSHSCAEFSHGLCPGCIDKIYPEFS